MELISAHERGGTQAHLSEKFGIGRSSVCEIIKRKDFKRPSELEPLGSDSDNDSEAQAPSSLGLSDVKSMLDEIKHFATTKDDRFLGPVQGMIDLVNKCIIEKQLTKKQSSMDDFIVKK